MGERAHTGIGMWHLGACAANSARNIVAEALRIGYRHIDTAQGYDNEAAVGEGIRASAVSARRYLRDHEGAPATHIDKGRFNVRSRKA